MSSVSTRLNILFKGVDKTGATTKTMESRFGSMAKRMAVSFAGIFGTRMLFNKAKEVMKEVHALNDEARQLGASVEFVQGLGNAFGQVGLSAEIAGKSLDFMRRNLATKSDMAGNIFEQMGMDAANLKKMGTEEMFMEIGKEIAKLPNEVDKVKATYEIFGRAGAKLVPLFRQGPDEFVAGLQGVMGMMPVVDKRIADSMSNIDDTFAVVKQTMFVDWAKGLGAMADMGEDSFGRVEVSIFKTFLKVREFGKNYVATMAWMKDTVKAIFTEDTIADAWDDVLDQFEANTRDTNQKLEAFTKGLEAKDRLAGLFEGANNESAELWKNVKGIKQELAGFTLAGTHKAVKKKLLREQGLPPVEIKAPAPVMRQEFKPAPPAPAPVMPQELRPAPPAPMVPQEKMDAPPVPTISEEHKRLLANIDESVKKAAIKKDPAPDIQPVIEQPRSLTARDKSREMMLKLNKSLTSILGVNKKIASNTSGLPDLAAV